MVVPFFGIFTPDFGQRKMTDEAPYKAGFFGGLPDAAAGAVPLSKAEQDACYLNGKSWEPDPVERAATRPYSFVSRYTP
ncbi:hypothetical protein [Devosia psychrophila]|jgi:hypothetical protein|uniref:Uncharacterized protein n=1 Tax=Devosia psychrophila TaxID=728005 RepID=A0A0F5PR08_9HYPH|nr:hypothetical protein [Devosia psychrophila]KKC31063.1 hypothetical protein WH91_21595 [Devosia psychrophila]SFD14304.1 hypothetical protein SAMN04488059_12345 [Devosia psychrophila]